MTKRFSRCREDFICENCGTKVIGNGYTNHCPSCLYSKHVDGNPGDRQATCQGIMKPVGVELKSGKYVIIHRCLKCGLEKKNEASKNDSFNIIIQLSTGPLDRLQETEKKQKRRKK